MPAGSTPNVQIPQNPPTATCCPCPDTFDCNCNQGCQIKCRSMATFATFCGYAEYTDPSVPPVYYLTQQLTGSADCSCGQNAFFCSSYECTNVITYSGEGVYDVNTCAFTNSGQVLNTGECNGGPSTLSRNGVEESDIFCTDVQPFLDTAVTQTTFSITTPMTCRSGESGFNAGECTSSSCQSILGNQDTIDNAIKRATPSTPTWDESDNGNCAEHTSWTALWEAGSREFAFQTAQVQVSVPNAMPGGTYQVTIMLSSRDTGSSGAFVPYGELSVTVQGAMTGPTLTPWIQLPQEQSGGIEIAAVGCTIQNLSG
jgi:hypothetical protein